jgi:hypothetical protein
MYCSKCGGHSGVGVSFCRKCGAGLESTSLARGVEDSTPERTGGRGLTRAQAVDPDEMLANGIGSAIVGDGFFITAVILSATHTSISSLLWLLLLIPAFYCFGRGLRDVLHARQIQRSRKQGELSAAAKAELPPPRASVADIIRGHTSGELLRAPRATKRTTGEL